MASLILRTQGGFANRVRAIISAALWAEDLGRKLVVYWPVEVGHMPCALDEILVPDSVPGLCCFHNGYPGKSHQVLSEIDMKSMIELFGNDPEIRIDSYSNFHRECATARGLCLLRQLRIRPELEGMADTLWKQCKGRTNWLAVHVRGADHVKCLQASPVTAFVERLRGERGQILLCTDEPTAVEALGDVGGDRIHMPVTIHSRYTKEAQALGIIDWLLLQKCSRILVSAGSSFSELAALRSGAELEVIQAQ